MSVKIWLTLAADASFKQALRDKYARSVQGVEPHGTEEGQSLRSSCLITVSLSLSHVAYGAEEEDSVRGAKRHLFLSAMHSPWIEVYDS